MPAQKKNTDTLETTTVDPTVAVDKATWDSILDGYKEMQSKIAKLEEKETPIITKEKYVGPRKFRYKLYPRIINNQEVLVPILSYRSIKADPKEGLIYQNQYGTYTNNHFVMLTIQGEKEEIKEPFTVLNTHVSDYTFAKFIEDPSGQRIKGDTALSAEIKNPVAYIFENENGEFRVLSNCIN